MTLAEPPTVSGSTVSMCALSAKLRARHSARESRKTETPAQRADGSPQLRATLVHVQEPDGRGGAILDPHLPPPRVQAPRRSLQVEVTGDLRGQAAFRPPIPERPVHRRA